MHINRIALWHKLANFVHEGTDRIYFRLCRAESSVSSPRLCWRQAKAATDEWMSMAVVQ